MTALEQELNEMQPAWLEYIDGDLCACAAEQNDRGQIQVHVAAVDHLWGLN